MIFVTDHLSLDESELGWEFVRSSGPGGQNVNKVATAVQLRFNVAASPRLSDEVKRRIRQIAGRRMTSDGVLVITARRFRYQERNREDALKRLIEIIRKAASPPKRRIGTVPSRSAREARLREKKLKSARKRRRVKKIVRTEE